MEFTHNSSLPMTGSKLNFYLAQSKRLKPINCLGSSESSPLLYQNSLAGSYNRSPPQQINSISLNQSQFPRPAFENKNRQVPLIEKMHNNESFFSDNSFEVLEHQKTLKHPEHYNDSLDGLFSQRVSKQRKFNQCQLFNHHQYSVQNSPIKKDKYLLNQNNANNCSFVSRDMSRGRENLQFFKHHKIEGSEKVHRSSPKRLAQRNQFDDGFKEISNQLSRITYELNKNSFKLNQMSKIYNHISRSPPPVELKRANLKYSVAKGQQKDIRRRPRVQYSPEIYQNHKMIIWQPHI